MFVERDEADLGLPAKEVKEVGILVAVVAVCGIVLMGICGHVIHMHNQVAQWPVATCHMTDPSRQQSSSFGSVSSTSVIATWATVDVSPVSTWSPAVLRRIRVAVQYPPPPQALNLKGKQEVMTWQASVSGGDIECQVNVMTPSYSAGQCSVDEAGPGPNGTLPAVTCAAVTYNVGVTWSYVGLIVGVLFGGLAVVVAGLVAVTCARQSEWYRRLL